MREDGEPSRCGFRPRISGMLLNARIAAVHFGVIDAGASSSSDTRQTLDRVGAPAEAPRPPVQLVRHRTLEPLEPRFVSTVDSGNLAASLWTLKQAALAFAAEPRSSAASRRNWPRS